MRQDGAARRAIDEEWFHRWLRWRAPHPGLGPLPMGDDAAAIPIGGHRVLLATTDAMIAGYHFDPRSPPRLVGRALAGVNLSDIAAKGGRPTAFLLDLLLPPGTRERWARDVVFGLTARLHEYGATLVGGDTKPSPHLALVGSLLGEADARHLAPRTGARPGDCLVVTGEVGAGGLAYRRWRERPNAPRTQRRLLEVTPRVREGRALARFAHAMMDTSDGLADSARLLAGQSGVRLVVDADRLPIVPGLRSGSGRQDDWADVFRGGDYELFAAVPRARLSEATAAVRAAGGTITEIGRVDRGFGTFLIQGGRAGRMPPGTWRPFERRRSARARRR